MNYFKLFATLVKAMVKSLSTRQYVLTFEKESDNLWYIKMPWAGHHHNLQMVAGANHLLETFKSRLVTVRVFTNRKNLQISVLPDNTTESLVVLPTRFPI